MEDTVSSWADGQMHKHAEDRMTGHCSLAATIAFDLVQWETQVIADIATMKACLASIGEGKRLTFAEMRKRGYRGAWAGMNETGQIVNV